jgi:hypothetical protein
VFFLFADSARQSPSRVVVGRRGIGLGSDERLYDVRVCARGGRPPPGQSAHRAPHALRWVQPYILFRAQGGSHGNRGRGPTKPKLRRYRARVARGWREFWQKQPLRIDDDADRRPTGSVQNPQRKQLAVGGYLELFVPRKDHLGGANHRRRVGEPARGDDVVPGFHRPEVRVFYFLSQILTRRLTRRTERSYASTTHYSPLTVIPRPSLFRGSRTTQPRCFTGNAPVTVPTDGR